MTVMQLNLPAFQRGRLWVDEYPGIPSYRDKARIEKWTSEGTVRAIPRKVAIEWFVPRGMGAMYGLLGAETSPKGTGFNIEVFCVENGIELFPDTIVSSPSEQVFCGLLCEYAESVMRGMREIATGRAELPRANVCCSIAAHGQVGSCNVIFRALGRALLQTLLLPRTPTETDVAALLVLDDESGRGCLDQKRA